MTEGPTIFDILKVIFFWMSPLLLLVGVVILLTGTEKFNKLEKQLGKEIGGIRKRVIPAIETNIDTFQNWLLKKRTIVGLLCIVCAAAFFLLFKR
jgi:hypothetical protein